MKRAELELTLGCLFAASIALSTIHPLGNPRAGAQPGAPVLEGTEIPERVRADPIEAFLGRMTVIDAYTREEEGAFEFICRHTLLRPRDLMTIGERLAALRPYERQSEIRFKEVEDRGRWENCLGVECRKP